MQIQEEGIIGFEEAVIKIEKLTDYNLPLAQFELNKYAKNFDKLSLNQQIAYQHLLAEIYILQGKFHLAKKTASDGLSLTLELSSPNVLSTKLLYNRGFAYESIGDIALATKDYESGLALAKTFHNEVLIAQGLVNLGAIYYLTDRYENSLIALNDAYNIAKKTDDEELKGAVNSELGILYANLNRNKQAMVYYQQSYEHYKNANQTMLSLNSLVNIGLTHIDDKEYEQAISVYKTIIYESKGFVFNQIIYSTYLGLSWAILKQEIPNSKQYMQNIEQYDIELQYSEDEAFILFELERYDEVLESIARVESMLVKHMPLSHSKMQTRINIIDLQSKTYAKLGRYQQAYELQEKRLVSTRILRDEKESQSVAEIRLILESKEADLQKKVLENKQELQKISLLEAEKRHKKQKLYLLYIAVVALILAWLLVKLARGQHQLYQISSVDMLTGIANRRELMKKGQKLFQHAKSKKTDFSVLIIDIDNFKKINDQFGHNHGDVVLKKVVNLGKTLMRKTDVFGRFGGEEFIVFLPNTSTVQAKIIAERYRQSVDDYAWEVNSPSKVPLDVSISIGVANSIDFIHDESADLSTVINKADILLYEAKEQGRNRVCI